MLRHRILLAGAPLIAAAALLLGSGASFAQHGGGGGHGGGGHSGGGGHGGGGGRSFAAPGGGGGRGFAAPGGGAWHGSAAHAGGWNGGAWNGNNWHGNNWHGNNWHGDFDGHHHGFYGYPGIGIGLGYGYPGYGYGYGYPSYGYANYGYPGYDYSYPYTPSTVISNDYYYPDTSTGAPVGYQSLYAQPAAPQGNTAEVDVVVPENASVWFNGVAMTNQSGAYRRFTTPPLVPGKEFTYEIRAQWMTESGPVGQTRSVDFQAGSQNVVNFMTKTPPRPTP
jgi:uncharacterized protein (TIGR03000 family)